MTTRSTTWWTSHRPGFNEFCKLWQPWFERGSTATRCTSDGEFELLQSAGGQTSIFFRLILNLISSGFKLLTEVTRSLTIH